MSIGGGMRGAGGVGVCMYVRAGTGAGGGIMAGMYVGVGTGIDIDGSGMCISMHKNRPDRLSYGGWGLLN